MFYDQSSQSYKLSKYAIWKTSGSFTRNQCKHVLTPLLNFLYFTFKISPTSKSVFLYKIIQILENFTHICLRIIESSM